MLEAYENTGWQGRTEDLARDHQRPRRALRTALAHGDEAFVDDVGARLGMGLEYLICFSSDNIGVFLPGSMGAV